MTSHETFDRSGSADKRIDTVATFGHRQFKMTTRKMSDGTLTTTAQVGTLDGDFVKHQLYRDFYENVLKEKVRVTAKAISAQHGKALADLDQIINRALAHYEWLDQVSRA